MDDVAGALADQMAQLDILLSGLDEDDWQLPSACPGWTIADVVLHLAQTDEFAAASARGEWSSTRTGWVVSEAGEPTVDDAAALSVEADRGVPAAEVYRRWSYASKALVDAFAVCDPQTRVQWVAGDLAARTLATTRLSECWIHTGDVAEGLGLQQPPTDRIWHIARLAHRTLPYAFARAGRPDPGPVSFRLTSPLDRSVVWAFGDDEPSGTLVSGPAPDLCLIAGQRARASETAVVASGPDSEAVLELVRTFA